MKKIVVCGAGGFIGCHLVKSLKKQGHYVIGADLKYPLFESTLADKFILCDLSVAQNVYDLFDSSIDEVWQLAADMGGAEYIFTGNHDADIMTNSASININVLKAMIKHNIKKVIYTSSACIYPENLQTKESNGRLRESDAYPANPDSEYGWEKLFSERLYMSYAKNYNLDVRIIRLHNVFGPLGTYTGGREKSPAAICRKILQTPNSTIEIFGDGSQCRSYLYIDDCILGMLLINESQIDYPINLGSDRMVTINELIQIVANIASKKIHVVPTSGPVGVAKRYSDNILLKQKVNWSPAKENLEYGLKKTYDWLCNELRNN
jgi:nucleoside-diphosphate-sugar epimerase